LPQRLRELVEAASRRPPAPRASNAQSEPLPAENGSAV
jgi:hypothetical protein